jgi:hypothetical protein
MSIASYTAVIPVRAIFMIHCQRARQPRSRVLSGASSSNARMYVTALHVRSTQHSCDLPCESANISVSRKLHSKLLLVRCSIQVPFGMRDSHVATADSCISCVSWTRQCPETRPVAHLRLMRASLFSPPPHSVNPAVLPWRQANSFRLACVAADLSGLRLR